jgi:hypothetical protein
LPRGAADWAGLRSRRIGEIAVKRRPAERQEHLSARGLLAGAADDPDLSLEKKILRLHYGINALDLERYDNEIVALARYEHDPVVLIVPPQVN